MPERSLRAEVAPVTEIPGALVAELYRLYEQCYDGSDPRRFDTDLQEKDWVILLRDPVRDKVAGFSTQMLMRTQVEKEPVSALFSGDTIIHPSYWGSQELVRAWCRFAGRLKGTLGGGRLFWFLISKGYRTYLYLPLFFRTFYPQWDAPTPPFENRLIQALGAAKYREEFDPGTGLIQHRETHDRLKMKLDGTAKRLRNPHVAYFLQRNPRYWNGDELVCVAEISARNMRSIARHELEIGLASTEPLRACAL